MASKPNYEVVFSQETLNKIVSYKNDLIARKLQPGVELKKFCPQKTCLSIKCQLSNSLNICC